VRAGEMTRWASSFAAKVAASGLDPASGCNRLRELWAGFSLSDT
jgi:hypothetical protein